MELPTHTLMLTEANNLPCIKTPIQDSQFVLLVVGFYTELSCTDDQRQTERQRERDTERERERKRERERGGQNALNSVAINFNFTMKKPQSCYASS